MRIRRLLRCACLLIGCATVPMAVAGQGACLLIDCATVPMAAAEQDLSAKQMAPPTGKALVYVYRSTLIGATGTLSVTLDGYMMGRTAPKTYFMWVLSPGEHEMTSINKIAGKTAKLRLRVEAGKTYFVQQKMTTLQKIPKLHLVDEQTGRKGVSKSGLIESDASAQVRTGATEMLVVPFLSPGTSLILEKWNNAFYNKTKNVRTTEYVKEGASIDKWQELVTNQHITGRQIGADELLREMKQKGTKECPTVEWNIRKADAGAVFYDFRVSNCELAEDQHEIGRVLEAREGLYRISYTKKTSRLDVEAQQKWTALMHTVRVQSFGNEARTRKERRLLKTALEGDERQVAKLLRKGVDVNIRDKSGVTPLFFAAFKGHQEIVRKLLAEGADVNIHAYDGFTALIYAAQQGHPKVLEILLDAGAEIDARIYTGGTALTQAAEKGQFDAVRYLVERGADVNATGIFIGSMTSPLCQGKHYPEIVQYLKEHGAKMPSGCGRLS